MVIFQSNSFPNISLPTVIHGGFLRTRRGARVLCKAVLSRCPPVHSAPGDFDLSPGEQLWQRGPGRAPQVVLRCGCAR